jgi:proline iminopeptidase
MAHPGERTATRLIDGVEIHERRAGAGPPVVVLHGGPGAHHDYLLPAFDALATDRQLIFYDQRGGGRSPVGRDVPVGWQAHVADLEALRGLWGFERLTLAGYSWGGLLAELYAVTHPERVERLALVSPAPCWREARDEFERRFQARTMSADLQAARKSLRESGLRERDPAGHAQRMFELAVAGYFHDPGRVTELTPFRVTERTRHAVWETLGAYDLRPALRRLSVPALVMHGDDDPIPWESAREAAECLRGEFILLRDCGHVPYVEAFDEFVRHLDRFLPRATHAV